MEIKEFQYTEREKDFLREYTCRKVRNPIYRGNSRERAVAAYLGIQQNRNAVINTYLGTGHLPDDVNSIDDLKSFMDRIETIFGIACKYGLTHKMPNILYREEEECFLPLFEDTEVYGKVTVTDTFKSFSYTKSGASIFKKDSTKPIELLTNSSEEDFSYAINSIPFIDVKNFLRCKSVIYDDEEYGNDFRDVYDEYKESAFDEEDEILLAPFILIRELENSDLENSTLRCQILNYYGNSENINLDYDQFSRLFDEACSQEERENLENMLLEILYCRCCKIKTFYDEKAFSALFGESIADPRSLSEELRKYIESGNGKTR